MIDLQAVESAERILRGAGKLGCNIDGVAVLVAKALLAEHERQERERCANCSYYLPRASGYPMCVSWGNDTDESDSCSRWKPVPKREQP
jgi:hypothetical protein